MKLIYVTTALIIAGLISLPSKAQEPASKTPVIEKPLIERYILDELKSLRNDNHHLREELTRRVADAKLESSDRALRYTTDTTNNIFYIITAAASLLVLVGWRSVKDIKENIKAETEKKISELIDSYEERLYEVEKKTKIRSDQILATQEEISNTNKLHSLWMRAGLAKSNDEKIALYDEILELQPNDVEAMTYKADALLDMNEPKWALSLADLALDQDEEYSLAYWQRACANAALGAKKEAVADIEKAIEYAPASLEDFKNEEFFKPLENTPEFKALLKKVQGS